MVVTLLTPVLVAQAKQSDNVTSKTFKVATETKIRAGDSKAAALAELKVGDKVSIAYKESDGTLTAERIRVLSDAKAGKGTKKGDGQKAEKTDKGLRARGIITAIDKAAGTITVDVKTPHKKT